MVRFLPLLLLATPVLEAECPDVPDTVTFKVDSFSDEGSGWVTVNFRVPPGAFHYKCAVRDKDGVYLGVADYTLKVYPPIFGPAASVHVPVSNQGKVTGADCIGIKANPKAL